MPAFSFPDVSPQEILTILAELQIPVPEGLLTKPTPEAVKVVYREFVVILTGVQREVRHPAAAAAARAGRRGAGAARRPKPLLTPRLVRVSVCACAQELEQAQFAAMGELKHPELHDEAVAELAFTRALQKLMDAVGMAEFSMQDVHRPTVKRTIKNMSAIINFAKFRESHLDKFSELASHSDGLQEQRQDMEDENAALKAQLEALRAQREESEPRSEEILAESEELHREVTSLNKQQMVLNNDIKELKAESNEYNDKIANDRFLIHGAKQECGKLKTQIVQSPEKIKKQLADKTTELESERGQKAEKESQLKSVRQRLDGVQKLDKDMKKNLAVMDELEAQAEKVKSSKLARDEIRANIESSEEELRALSNQEGTVRRQLAATKEKTARTTTDGEAALQEAQMRYAHSTVPRNLLFPG